VSLPAGAELSAASLDLFCAAEPVDELSRGLLSEAEDDESLRRGAGSCAGALLLIAWVLLSTSEPKESLVEVS
uniref:hypothetical protein n=1 Tax=Escherichia coli TaxID=562 RepID=UPI0013D75EBD